MNHSNPFILLTNKKIEDLFEMTDNAKNNAENQTSDANKLAYYHEYIQLRKVIFLFGLHDYYIARTQEKYKRLEAS